MVLVSSRPSSSSSSTHTNTHTHTEQNKKKFKGFVKQDNGCVTILYPWCTAGLPSDDSCPSGTLCDWPPSTELSPTQTENIYINIVAYIWSHNKYPRTFNDEPVSLSRINNAMWPSELLHCILNGTHSKPTLMGLNM